MRAREINYMSLLTGEVVETIWAAMELYRAGHEMVVIEWKSDTREWVQRLTWVH